MRIIGISAFYHDSAAALIEDGLIVAAAQEERFTRRKHEASFPTNALDYCLNAADISLNEVDYVAFYDKPFLKFERLLETYIAFAPRGFKSFAMAMPLWLREKLFQKNLIRKELNRSTPGFDWENRLLFAEHHQSHGASAFYPSPYRKAAVLTMDGVGEWATTSLAMGEDNRLETLREIHFPHSLGLLYSAFTYYTGFRVNSGEYKLMGLAPYGRPVYRNLIWENLIDVKDDGSFRLNLEYFDYCTGLRMTNEKFDKLFGGAARLPESLLTQRDMDLAASIQSVIEEVVLRLVRGIVRETKAKSLCLAGGVALNCVANGRIYREGGIENLWIQPAAGDAGGALGSALLAYHMHLSRPRKIPGKSDTMQGGYLGPEFTNDEIESRLRNLGAVYVRLEAPEVVEKTASALIRGSTVGWFQGRMEFGPRALGGRSILADARLADTQKSLNLKIKFRESFRPFAPAVLREDVAEWFEFDDESPYMLIVAGVKMDKRRHMTKADEALFGIEKLNVVRSEIPAVTHVDYSARIQTVDQERNAKFYDLLSAFKERTGCPVLANTSFNIRGEPIVASPDDAFRCFMGTDLDVLVIGDCYLEKTQQNLDLRHDYREKFQLD